MAQLTFAEFLLLTAYVDDSAVIHDVTLLNATQAADLSTGYSIKTYGHITPNTANQFFSLMGVLDDIEANVTNPAIVEVITGIPTTIGMLCKVIIKTLDGAGSGFAADPATQDGVLNRIASGLLVAAGVYSAAIDVAFFAQAETTTYPFTDKTLEDVLKIRQPAAWLDCNHGAEPHTISASAKDTFGFSASLVETSDSISIRCTWATAVGAQEFVSQRKLTMSADSLHVSQSFSRASLGLPSEARVLKFEYLAAYDGVVTSLSVSK